MYFLFLIIVGAVIAYSFIKERNRKKIEEKLHDIEDTNFFKIDEYCISADFNSAIAIDKHSKFICLQDDQNNCYYYDQQYIITSEIIINEETKHKKPFLSVLGRYLIWKWFGGQEFGEVISNATKVSVIKEINSIILKVVVNDLNKPTHSILFLQGKTSKRKIEGALHQAQHWDSLVKIFIHLGSQVNNPL